MLQLVEKVRKDFFDKLGKISKLVAQVLKFCDSDAKENPDGFLSHYLSLRILWPKRFFDSLASFSFKKKKYGLIVRDFLPGSKGAGRKITHKSAPLSRKELRKFV